MAKCGDIKRRAGKQSKSGGAGKRPVSETTIPPVLPVLPAKDLVAFPSVMISLYVGRPQSVKAVEQSLKKDKLIFVVTQRSEVNDQPAAADLYTIGVVANVVRTLKLPDGRYKVLLQGIVRGRAIKYQERENFLIARVRPLFPPPQLKISAEDEVIMNRIRENLQILVEHEHLPEEMLLVTEELDDPGILSDVVIAHYKLDAHYAQNILEELDALKRLKITDSVITDDMNQFFISERIRNQARDELSKGQREYYLREQMKQIQLELGEQEGSTADLAALKRALEEAKLPEHAKEEANKQFKRLERMNAETGEYALLRTYLEWIADLPWSVMTKDCLDLKRAKRVLDEDHYGLDKPKQRILEYLGVRKLNPASKGPILCFVGPPGVGKTSLARSIARALGRKYFRMSLGGVRDEAEIRGHRRTYVGALPGRIIQGLKQAGSRNAVFVLDELDKIGTDFRGDPASALLEVLDPQQNKEFRDHYLNVSFDLSEVLFITTANTIDTVPDALLDRLEVIYLSGYTSEEKVHIAKRFLIPRQLKDNGLEKIKIEFSDDAIIYLIERYTREAGVRNLEREIGSVCRKIARSYAESGRVRRKVSPEVVAEALGATRFDPESTELRDVVGLARGLAWTTHGGELMPVEVSLAKGKGELCLTGQLGNIMRESAQAAVFYARSNAEILGLNSSFHDKFDIHVHVPGGATPKDGPSAGITIAAALVSALSQRAVSKEVAMTGEITLRGNILPVGGLKEKALAALRHGIKKVIIPYDNIKDIEEIPKEQRAKIKFIPVKHISEVLEIALLGLRKETAARTLERANGRKRKVKPSLSAEC